LKVEPQYAKFEGNYHVLTEAFQYVLSKHECMTQGWVLSGYPKTPAQALALFNTGEPETVAAPKPAADDEEAGEEAEGSAAASAPVVSEPAMVPQWCVVVKGLEALKSDLLPPATAYVQHQEVARSRFQSVQSVAEAKLTKPDTKAAAIELVLQSVGTAKHPLSDKPGEGLLDRYTKMYDTVKELKPVVQDQSPVKQRPGSDEKSQEPDSGFILDAAAEKEQLLLEKKQTALLPAVEEELLANVDASEMSAREYAMKYAMPALHRGLCMVGRVRPEDPVDFMGQFMLDYDPSSTEVLEPGNLILPAFGTKK